MNAVRLLTVDDLEAIAPLCRRAIWGAPTPAELQAALFPPDHEVTVLGDPEAGLVAVVATDAGAWVRLLVVAPDHRRAGLGRALLEAAERHVGGATTLRLGGDPIHPLWPGVVGTDVALVGVAEACGYEVDGAGVAMEAELRGPLPADPGGWRIAAATDEAALLTLCEAVGEPGWPLVRRALADDGVVVATGPAGDLAAFCSFDVTVAGTFGPIAGKDHGALHAAVVGTMRTMRTRGHVRAEVPSARPVRTFAGAGFHVSKVYLRAVKVLGPPDARLT